MQNETSPNHQLNQFLLNDFLQIKHDFAELVLQHKAFKRFHIVKYDHKKTYTVYDVELVRNFSRGNRLTECATLQDAVDTVECFIVHS